MKFKAIVFCVIILLMGYSQTTTASIPSTENKIIVLNYERLVKLTWYNPDDPLQTDDSPGIMAWGKKYEDGDKVVAVSRDLEKLGLKQGVKVKVNGRGVYSVEDRMHERKRSQLDIAIKSKQEALRNGVQKGIAQWTEIHTVSEFLSKKRRIYPEKVKIRIRGKDESNRASSTNFG